MNTKECYLDAVCELLQSFGSDRLHGGDECGQLVLGARCRSLQAKLIYFNVLSLLQTTINKTETMKTCRVESNSDLFIFRCLRIGKMVRTAE